MQNRHQIDTTKDSTDLKYQHENNESEAIIGVEPKVELRYGDERIEDAVLDSTVDSKVKNTLEDGDIAKIDKDEKEKPSDKVSFLYHSWTQP